MPRISFHRTCEQVDRVSINISDAEELALLGMTDEQAREWLMDAELTASRKPHLRCVEVTNNGDPHMWIDSNGTHYDLDTEEEQSSESRPRSTPCIDIADLLP